MRRTREQLAADEPRGCRTFWGLDDRAKDASVSLVARGVWRIIDTFANRYGENAFPSTAKLSEIAGFSDRKTIYPYLTELEQAGWIVRYHPRGKVNSYIVIYPVKGRKPVPKNGTTSHLKPVPFNGIQPVPKNGTLSHSTIPSR